MAEQRGTRRCRAGRAHQVGAGIDRRGGESAAGQWKKELASGRYAELGTLFRNYHSQRNALCRRSPPAVSTAAVLLRQSWLSWAQSNAGNSDAAERDGFRAAWPAPDSASRRQCRSLSARAGPASTACAQLGDRADAPPRSRRSRQQPLPNPAGSLTVLLNKPAGVSVQLP